MTTPHTTDDRSYWNATSTATDFPELTGQINVDVAIIGGGIVGTTTARVLKDRGAKVALIEARRVGR
jgi:glycerol-3-phosphate dehydrogenase